MNTIVMNMDGCDIEHAAPVDETYSDEVLCAEWNPQLALVSASPVEQRNSLIDLPADLANGDVDTFLKKMYEYQC
jgi:hypothetical protein